MSSNSQIATASSSDSMALSSSDPITELPNSTVTRSVKSQLESPYNDQPLGPGEIRLLSITSIPTTKPSLHHVYPWLPGKLDIHLITKRVQVSSHPNFTAVSYVWGTGAAKIDVSCNSSSLLVTQSCYNMLVHLSAYKDDYWIDAICIDQANATEKAAQIPFMRNIYAQAACVLLYLGPGTESTYAFMKEFPRVQQLARMWKSKQRRRGDVNWRGDEWPGDDDMFWEGYYYILGHEWFRRLWTFQEAVLARKALIVCGYREVDMDAFMHFQYVGSDHEGYAPWSPDIARRVARGLDLVHEGIESSIAIRWLRRHYGDIINSGAGVPSVHIPMLVFELRYARVKELVDRVWAIVALMSPVIQEKLSLVVDYSERGRKEYWRTYIQFAKTVFMSGSLHLLNIPPSMGRGNEHVPSWCPNLSERPCCLFTINCTWNQRGDHGNWLANGLLAPEAAEKTIAKRDAILNHDKKLISVSEDERILNIRGFIVDTVSEVVEDPALHGKADDLIGHPWPRPDKRNPDDDAFFAFYSRALALARRTIDGAKDSTSIPPQYLMSLMLDDGISDIVESAYQHAWTALMSPRVNYFKESLSRDQHLWANGIVNRLISLTGHSVFATEAGRFCIADTGCKRGDKVCAFYGGESLYMLHRADAEAVDHEHGDAEFWGVAYIPHLMEQGQREEARLSEDEIFHIR
jgi:hypothetical protein